MTTLLTTDIRQGLDLSYIDGLVTFFQRLIEWVWALALLQTGQLGCGVICYYINIVPSSYVCYFKLRLEIFVPNIDRLEIWGPTGPTF